MEGLRRQLADLLVQTLQELDTLDCKCETAVMMMHPPEE